MIAAIDLAAIWQKTWAVLVIVIAVLPSLITALTPYPKIDGPLKTLQKILGFFSILTHPDSYGTLKAPLTPTQPPPIIGETVAAK
jgi:hypothetical protein